MQSTDVEEHAASLHEWNQRYEQLTPGRFVGSLHEARFRDVQLFREATEQSLHQAGVARPGTRAVGVPVRVEGNALFRGEAVGADTLITLGSGDELDFYTPRRFDLLAVSVDERVLEAHAVRIEHRDAAAVFGGRCVLKPNPERLEGLRALLASVLQSLDANPAALGFQQTQRVLEQSTLTALFAAASDEDDAMPRKAPFCPSRRVIVEQAKSHMRAHIDETITVADLCVHLGVSRRTLQYSFQQVLGINPVRLLRAMRLNGVRRDLKAGLAATPKVSDVAAKWGFWHLGHFVTEYKQMFGELPSDTVRSTGRVRRGRSAPQPRNDRAC